MGVLHDIPQLERFDSPTSTLTAGGSYQWDNALPLFTGVLLNSDLSDPHLPRSTSLTFDWAFHNTRMPALFPSDYRLTCQPLGDDARGAVADRTDESPRISAHEAIP